MPTGYRTVGIISVCVGILAFIISPIRYGISGGEEDAIVVLEIFSSIMGLLIGYCTVYAVLKLITRKLMKSLAFGPNKPGHNKQLEISGKFALLITVITITIMLFALDKLAGVVHENTTGTADDIMASLLISIQATELIWLFISICLFVGFCIKRVRDFLFSEWIPK